MSSDPWIELRDGRGRCAIAAKALAPGTVVARFSGLPLRGMPTTLQRDACAPTALAALARSSHDAASASGHTTATQHVSATIGQRTSTSAARLPAARSGTWPMLLLQTSSWSVDACGAGTLQASQSRARRTRASTRSSPPTRRPRAILPSARWPLRCPACCRPGQRHRRLPWRRPR